MMPIPPIGGNEIVVRGGVVPKVQTTSAKNVENGLLWARWSAFWHSGACRGVLFARQPLNMRVGGAAHARVIGLTCGL